MYSLFYFFLTGDPQSVLNAIDIFGYARHWMMHASHTKGAG